ncbi:MAG: alanine racemase, partial [Bacillaceae bacterium]|nr:alanine racemase [Bacillaceae bacterium]
GMGRLGVRTLAELDSLLAALKKSNWIRTEGVFTHFAAADTLEGDYYQKQLEKFQAFLSRFPERPEWIHASNSAAALLHPEAAFNLVRTGIVMYGLSPSEEIKPALPFPLKPALSLHSRLSHVKKAEKGAKISYGCTYTAEQDEWIGTVPIGYADGWLRDLQGQEVLVNGKRAPIVGRICMDQCMIRLPERVEPGTLVTLIGRQGDEEISADEIARKRNTINYEIVSTLSQRIPRIYKQGEKIVKIKNSLFS